MRDTKVAHQRKRQRGQRGRGASQFEQRPESKAATGFAEEVATAYGANSHFGLGCYRLNDNTRFYIQPFGGGREWRAAWFFHRTGAKFAFVFDEETLLAIRNDEQFLPIIPTQGQDDDRTNGVVSSVQLSKAAACGWLHDSLQEHRTRGLANYAKGVCVRLRQERR